MKRINQKYEGKCDLKCTLINYSRNIVSDCSSRVGKASRLGEKSIKVSCWGKVNKCFLSPRLSLSHRCLRVEHPLARSRVVIGVCKIVFLEENENLNLFHERDSVVKRREISQHSLGEGSASSDNDASRGFNKVFSLSQPRRCFVSQALSPLFPSIELFLLCDLSYRN